MLCCPQGDGGSSIPGLYAELLLDPQHWFAVWRLNCFLAAYHAWLTASKEYLLEDKGLFLRKAQKANLPVRQACSTLHVTYVT